MTQSRVAERYAKALLDLANEENAVDQVYQDMVSFNQSLQESDELKWLMNNPVVGSEKKSEIFTQLFQSKMSPITFGFLNLVLKKRRESDFEAIAQSFIDLYNQQKGITRLTITTAVPIDKNTLNEIVSKIKQQQHFDKVETVTKVDENIIGGFIAEFNNQILDQSVETNLNQIKRRLTSIN